MLDHPERPPIATQPLSAILLAPSGAAYQEEIVTAWIAQLERLCTPYELLLVASTEQAGAGEAMAERHPRLRILGQPSGRGPGAALRAGLEAAKHPLIFYTTCDRQYQPADLALLYKWIDKVDLVSGCRVSPEGRRHSGVGEAMVRPLVRFLFAVRLPDVNCWFVLARRSIFRRIPIQSESAFAQAEILAKANHLGCVMTEVPVKYQSPDDAPAQTSATIWRPRLSELSRVFSLPDFGPAVLSGPG